VIFAVVYLLGSKNGEHSFGAALGFAGLYTLLFIPFGYMFDRFAHNRWQRRAEQQAAKRPAKKR
jgi:cytochrome bd-type quinol oxidase subunit 1